MQAGSLCRSNSPNGSTSGCMSVRKKECIANVLFFYNGSTLNTKKSAQVIDLVARLFVDDKLSSLKNILSSIECRGTSLTRLKADSFIVFTTVWQTANSFLARVFEGWQDLT